MRIRKATLNDIQIILDLAHKLMECHLQFDEYYELGSNSCVSFSTYFENMIRSRDAVVLAAEDNGIVIGYLAAKIEERPPVYKEDKRGRVDTAYVLENYRGQGIGRKLTARALERFKNRQIKHVELSVDSRNELGYRCGSHSASRRGNS
jgi:ribosomal protein S18 acetylase RimI-like enzyme